MEVIYLDKEKREDEETTIDQDGVMIEGVAIYQIGPSWGKTFMTEIEKYNKHLVDIWLTSSFSLMAPPRCCWSREGVTEYVWVRRYKHQMAVI